MQSKPFLETRNTFDGFYRNKAKTLLLVTKRLKGISGRGNLIKIEDLVILFGRCVGEKTANVLLGSGFGKRAIVVDTHVFRGFLTD